MGTNYTVTINNHDEPAYAGNQIRKAEMNFNAPFVLKLSDKTTFQSEWVVRHIPKRRMVVFGKWKDKPVVAKLFFDRHRAAQQMASDVRGVNTLREHRIPTPALLFEGEDEQKQIKVLIFERIQSCQSLEDIWNQQSHPDDVWEALKAVTIELATQHVFGILQHDLHLKNFLLTDKVTYTLDGAQIELLDPILPKFQSMQNMALFLAQFGVGHEALQTQLYQYYASARGWALKPEDINELQFEIKRINENRWRRYAKKIFRNCTAFKRIKTLSRKGMFDRSYDGAEFQAFLKNPDAVFQHVGVKMLKNGRSSTVIKVPLDGRELVIKRYNLKSIGHRLRRMLRQTRAAKSWRLANKLRLFGIATAKPVAYIENNVLGFRGRSYYVTEYVSGENVVSVIAKNQESEEIVDRVVDVLKNLVRVDMTHGDLKASNIIIDADHHPVIIDLDGAAEHISLSGLRRAWKKEIGRFLQNFDVMPSVREMFVRKLEI